MIRKVLFKDNALGGVLVEGLISGSPLNYTIENNTFVGGQHGIRINLLEEQTISSTIRNNIFFDQSAAPIKIDSTADGGVEYSYNLFSSCGQVSGGVCGATDWYDGTLSPASDAHDNLLNLDPEFTNPVEDNYTLQPGSPAIDAGDPTTVNEMGFDGYIPQRTDIGAFETELFIEPPSNFFQEVNGQVVIEAEHFTTQFRDIDRAWLAEITLADYTGPGYMSSLPDTDLQFPSSSSQTIPSLNYTINFTTTGVYTVWLRGYAPNGAGDSIFASLDDQPAATLTGFAPRTWSWASTNSDSGFVIVEIDQPGLHTLHLRQREDGLQVDRIILTTDNFYKPSGNGPPESDQIN
ncbi:MAG: hypothetical protein GY796_20380 [Chloroflexi bacterium]|nr:hypothetical protein [Chloroflexota bacterium]